jgi:hypothetical protein
MSDMPGQSQVPDQPLSASAAVVPPPFDPAPPSEPRKNRHVLLWVFAGFLVLGLCAAGVAIAVIGGFLAVGAGQESTIAKADASYAKGVGALTEVGGGFDSIQAAGADVTAVEEFAVQSKTTLDSARADLAASRKTIETLGDSDARTTYVQAVQEADKGLESIGAMLDELTGKTALLAQVDTATVSYGRANDRINAAVTALNKDQWAAAGTAAAEAKALFEAARAGFAKAQTMDVTAGMEKAVAYADAQIQRAAIVSRMAAQGPAGGTKAYNLLVGELNALNKRIAAMPEPEVLTNEGWATARLDSLRQTAIASLTRADELMASAHQLFAAQ